jgi:hypothetical protein
MYRVVPTTFGFLGLTAVLGNAFMSCSFEALCGVHGRIRHRSTLFLVAFNRYGLHIVLCEI